MSIEIVALPRKTLGGKSAVKTFKLPEPPGWDGFNAANRYVYEYGLRQSIQDAAADADTVADAHASMDARVKQITDGERPVGRESDPRGRYAREMVIRSGIATKADLKGKAFAEVIALVTAKRGAKMGEKVAAAVARMVELAKLDASEDDDTE